MNKQRLFFGNGKVANIISRPNDVVLSRRDCDIRDITIIKKVLLAHKPTIVINSAAKTNLEYCQTNKQEAFESNTVGVLNILEACKELKIKFVHISSGCLFDGNETVSTEESSPTPRVWYTWTKTWADQAIEQYGYENYLILRPRQMISKFSHPTNMLTKFLALESISAIKEPNSLTCVEDFGEMMEHLIEINAKGIYNCCNDGVVTPYEIAVALKERIKPSLVVTECSYEEFLSRVPNKRVNTILSNQRLKNSGYQPRTAISALNWCISNYGK